ncbi:Bactericidal permeability increasing protein [Trichuris trichiura]|uniref:Bactericidal permeability increasing protein n=1 Tax=Trichuris trichiura TaxID=36087 RepID=A0A077ZGU4_TRITR|nr:Bactericidal permeability increasing protein [Trichuris trichiura]
MRLLDDRVFYVTLDDVAINVYVKLTKLPSGQMHAEISGCNFYLGDVSVQTKHSNKHRFSYSRIAERKLRTELENGMCEKIIQKGGKAMNAFLGKYPTKVHVSEFLPRRHRSKSGVKNRASDSVHKSTNSLAIFGRNTNTLRNVVIDTSLLSDPKVVNAGLLQFDVRGNAIWMGRNPAPFYPPPIRPISRPSNDSMLVIYISESVPNALLHHLHKHGILKLRIDKNSKMELSSLLKNDCQGWFCLNSFLPQFHTMYPSKLPVIYLTTRSAPVVHIDPRMVTVEIDARISLNAEDEDRSNNVTAEVLTLDIKAFASVVPYIQGNRLKAKVLSATMKTTTQRDMLKVDPNKVEVLVDILRKSFEDSVQNIGKSGIELPRSSIFAIRSGRAYLLDKAIEFDFVLTFNEKVLLEKLNGLFGGLMS